MAESGSPSNSDIPPPSSSSSAAAPPDWEVLTMSMSASAVGNPGDNDSSSNPEAEFSSDVWMDPGASRDEPFTEGWKPHLSASSSVYGYVAESKDQESPPLSSEGAETYFESKASMTMPEGLLVSEKNDGDVKKSVLAHNLSMDGDKILGEVLKDNLICKGRKRSKKSSTVVWSIAVVASVVGIVLLGNRLRLACNQNQQLELQLSAKEEKLNEMLLQVNRLKELLGNHNKVPVSRN